MEEEIQPNAMHVFLCQNHRADGKASCADRWDADDALRSLKQLARDAGLSHLRVTRAGCLGPCEKGPNLLVYPQKLWFHGVAREDLPAIALRLAELAEPGNPHGGDPSPAVDSPLIRTHSKESTT
jgi:(2Fe-2S) ferredoxin